MQQIMANDARLSWEGAISLETGSGWVMPWRLPFPDLKLYPPEGLQLAASKPAGVRLRFATDAEVITFSTEPMAEAGNLDLYSGSQLLASVNFAQGDTQVEFKDLPPGLKPLELWLHQMTPFQLRSIQLPAGATLEKNPDLRPKWLTYGSSITHCGAAGSPSFTWPGVVARKQNLNLTSLGYGGQCHADPMLARLIRDLPADFISVKIGINIYGNSSLNQRSFLPALIGFLTTIREGHPDIPLVACSPIWSAEREETPNDVGFTLMEMRALVAEAVALLQERGDQQLFYVDGLKLFGPELAAHLPDNLHPDAEGYKRLGENFVREVFGEMGVRISA